MSEADPDLLARRTLRHHRLFATGLLVVMAALTLASYAAGPKVEVYLEHLKTGSLLPEMPLFLRPDRYVSVPLESTCQQAYNGLPAYWRGVIEGTKPAPE